MYLEKTTRCHSGEYVGADGERNLYKSIVAFMIVGLKIRYPTFVQAIPGVKFSGEFIIALMILYQQNFVNEVSSLITTLPMCIHFLHLLQSSIQIQMNTSSTQEILTRKRTYFVIRCIS